MLPFTLRTARSFAGDDTLKKSKFLSFMKPYKIREKAYIIHIMGTNLAKPQTLIVMCFRFVLCCGSEQKAPLSMGYSAPGRIT